MLIQKEGKKRHPKENIDVQEVLVLRILCEKQLKEGTECRVVTQGHYHKDIKQLSSILVSYLCIFPLLLPPLP